MAIEEIDLYKLRVEDLVKYLPGQNKGWAEFAQKLIDQNDEGGRLPED